MKNWGKNARNGVFNTQLTHFINNTYTVQSTMGQHTIVESMTQIVFFFNLSYRNLMYNKNHLYHFLLLYFLFV